MTSCYRCYLVCLSRCIFFILSSMLFWSLPGNAERVESIQQNPPIDKRDTASNTSAFLGTGYQAFTIDLPGNLVDMKTISGNKTGNVYSLPFPVTASQVSWEPIMSGGYVTRIHVSSKQAKHLRFHLVVDSNIRPISFRVQGNLDKSPIGPVNDTDTHGGEIWLPVTNGNSADLEIFVDGSSPPERLNLKVDAVNLIVADISDNSVPQIVVKSLGLAKQKEYDLACATDVAIAQGSPEIALGLEEAAGATARIHFVTGNSSYACTGTLLADKGQTRIPWFATANHCIPDQATANTISFDWFFQATTCGGKTNDSRYMQTVGGAQLLWTNATLDASFLKLNRPPANGAILSGWDTDIQVGDLVWGVHHPKGDQAMVSEGIVTALLEPGYTQDGQRVVLDTINYSYGGVENGSSGSGLFSLENGHAYWKGTLTGGPAGNYQIAKYSDFASYYPNLKSFLDNPSLTQTGCLLNWAEVTYPELFSPAKAFTLVSLPYIYRYYRNTNTYVGISSKDNHVYYLDPDGVLQDEGSVPSKLAEAGC